MNPLKTLMTIAFVAGSTALMAQVQINKPIQLTGSPGDRMVTNLDAPVNPADATNKAYVDAAVAAAGGGGGATMVSDESPSAMNLGDAIRYCKNLVESTYDDWYFPTYIDLLTALSKAEAPVTNDASTNAVMFQPYDAYFKSYDASTQGLGYFRLSDGRTTYVNMSTPGTQYVRCVR